MTSSPTLHATAVVFCGKGLLLQGASGSGKSDFALRIMDAGGSLVADDYAEIVVREGKLFALPPVATAGLMEVRGVGLLKVPYLRETRIDMAIECVSRESIERMPERRETEIAGITLALWRFFPFESSAVAKVRTLLHNRMAHE